MHLPKTPHLPKKTPIRSKREDTRVCIHEAAHLVACLKTGVTTPHVITVDPGEGYSGRVIDPGFHNPAWKKDFLRDNPKFKAGFRQQDEKMVVVSLAGIAAECRHKRYSFGGSYLFITNLVSDSDLDLPVEDRLGDPDYYDKDITDAYAHLEVYQSHYGRRHILFGTMWEQTYCLVGRWWSDIRRVAVILQAQRTLDRVAIFEIEDLLKIDPMEYHKTVSQMANPTKGGKQRKA